MTSIAARLRHAVRALPRKIPLPVATPALSLSISLPLPGTPPLFASASLGAARMPAPALATVNVSIGRASPCACHAAAAAPRRVRPLTPTVIRTAKQLRLRHAAGGAARERWPHAEHINVWPWEHRAPVAGLRIDTPPRAGTRRRIGAAADAAPAHDRLLLMPGFSRIGAVGRQLGASHLARRCRTALRALWTA